MIRDLYPSDLILILFNRGPASSNEAGSSIFSDTEKATCNIYGLFLRQWLVPNERRFSWVYKDGNIIYGLLSAKERSTGASWVIDYLLLSENNDTQAPPREEITGALLETLTFHASKRSVRKVFFRSFSSNPLLQIFQKSDFKLYLAEYVFQVESQSLKAEKDKPSSGTSGDSGAFFRSRQPEDDDMLYELIYRMQPAQVKNAETINLKEWKDTREKGCVIEKEIVLVKDNSLQGCFSLKKGLNWGHFRVLAYSPETESLERILTFAIGFLRNKKHIYCTVRGYQEKLKKMLEERGFQKKEEFALAFKEISITEKKPVLVSQQA